MSRRLSVFAAIAFLAAAGSAEAADVTLACGTARPPWYLPDQPSVEFELMQKAMASKGHTVTCKSMPENRSLEEFAAKAVDGILRVNVRMVDKEKLSDPFVTYQNAVFTPAAKNLTVKSVQDLKGVTLAAFQGATNALGPEFKAMIEGHKAYREVADRETVVALLYGGRVDAVVLDTLVFAYFKNKVKDRVDISAKVNEYPIFAPTVWHVAFHDPALLADFNAGLKALRDSGEYDRVIAKYKQ